MSSTVTVVVNAPYTLFDDEGQALICGDGTYAVDDTLRIQNYIDLGQLIVLPDEVAPQVAAEAVDTTDAPVKKARTSVQKENSDG